MNNMVNLMKTVIGGGRMKLSEISERIETLYVGGRITAEERAELVELMHSKASPDAELGDYRAMYEALARKHYALQETVAQLAADVAALKAAAGDLPDGGETAKTVPEWEPYDGVSAGYAYGDVVMHGGKYWISRLNGMANVWEPGAMGVDERYWQEITEDEALADAGE